MRYFLNVYRTGFVYIGLRFYTTWTKSGPTSILKIMTKLLIFTGENQKFDNEMTINAILAISGLTKARRGKFIGAIFECEYNYEGTTTLVRLSQEVDTVTAEGLDTCALSFALELQNALSVDLSAVDTDYSFQVALRDFQTVEQLKQAVLA